MMLTTERKIEIATYVMNDPRLGETKESGFFRGICNIASFEVQNMKEFNLFKDELEIYRFGEKSGNNPLIWFTLALPEARTERIDFLKKYIQHLKDKQEPPMMGMSY